MGHKLLRAGALALVSVFSLVTSEAAQAPKPDFSGKWQLNASKSDDAAHKIEEGMVDIPGSRGPMERQRLLERLTQLAQAMDYFEITQSERDFQFADQAGNVRIYYIDGKKHPRQTPWGEKLETLTTWEGNQLQVLTDGKEIGQVKEIFGLEGRELVFLVRIRPKGLKNDILVKSYYVRPQT